MKGKLSVEGITRLNDVAKRMVSKLEYHAHRCGVDLDGVTLSSDGNSDKNFNTVLDDLFNDGGEARCVYFGAVAADYLVRHGYKIESQPHDDRWWIFLERAIDIFNERHSMEVTYE